MVPLTWVRAGRVLQAPVRPAIPVATFIIKVNIFMGRPPGRIQDRPFQMRVSNEFLERVDEWRVRQPGVPSRAEAIRRLTTGMLQILDNDPGDLASRAGLSVPTVRRAEAGARVSDEAQGKLQQALEAAGIEFIEENSGGVGVRFQKPRRSKTTLEPPGIIRLTYQAA
jgi:hypothetical protein